MSAIDRTFESLSFLPESVRDALRRRLREMAGLALIVVAMLLAVALATWSCRIC
jgi:S-DNA-T family DNA segregation ATPase FtsK/SpoIIIE